MIKQTHQFFEDYAAAKYHFEKCGDKIPMHSHTKEMGHDVTVFKGAVWVNDHIVRCGETYKFDSTQPHEITAMVDDTITFHVYDVFPTHYLNLPKACLEGTIG